MVKLILSIIVTSILLSPAAFAGKYVKLKKDRTIYVQDQISDLTPQAKKLMKLAKKSKEPIHIYLDTPGGSVVGGLILIRAIERVKSRGTKVICVVDGMSMSMGMHLMAACSKNYALPTTLLMYHDIFYMTVFAKISEKSSKRDGKQLRLLGSYLNKKLHSRLKVSKQVFEEYLDNEYVQLAVDFTTHSPGFLTIVNDIRIVK